MAGESSLTPFLFSSNQELSKTANSWYVMWINPSTFTIDFQTNQSEVLTKGGYGWYHWQNKLPRISFSGVSGWIFKAAQGTSTYDRVFDLLGGKAKPLTRDDFIGPRLSSALDGVDTALKGYQKGSGKSFWDATAGLSYSLSKAHAAAETPNTVDVNDPRLFVSRLQRVALQSAYFNDAALGYRRYNMKYIFVHTKRYPEGKKLEGFFPTFKIPETAEDSQLIKYDATFVVQSGLEDEELNQSSFANFLKVVGNTASFIGDVVGLFGKK